VLGEDFSEPRFHPVWAKAEELGAVPFIHPQSTPDLARRFRGNGWLANTIGNPLDTTIALQHLIFEGTLDRFPGLKIIAAHGGGYLASYAARSDHACFVSPQNCNPEIKLKKKPSEYLNQLYSMPLCSPPRRSATSWRKLARAKSCLAATIRSRGSRIRWTTSSPLRP